MYISKEGVKGEAQVLIKDINFIPERLKSFSEPFQAISGLEVWVRAGKRVSHFTNERFTKLGKFHKSPLSFSVYVQYFKEKFSWNFVHKHFLSPFPFIMHALFCMFLLGE